MARSLLARLARAIFGRENSLQSRPRIRPALEPLEDRVVPYALSGYHWASTNLSVSYLPDGTPSQGYASSLFATLDAIAPTATWQREFARALQTWANVTPLNFHFVADDGAPSGTASSNQGDIRLGAHPLSPGEAGVAYYPTGTSLAGDIFLDPRDGYSIGNGGNLFYVLAHESGHALGLAHSAVAGAVMYPYLLGAGNQTPDDVAGMQAIYGARQPDAYDALATNGTFATATRLTLDASGWLATTADLTTLADVDYYQVSAPANSDGTLTVSVDPSNLSLLAPKLLVYDANHNLVGSADAGQACGTAATLDLRGLTPGQTYYLVADGATDDVFGMGAYRLNVQFGHTPLPPTVSGVPSDGAGSDIDFQSSTTALSANWSGVFSDSQSGITGYQWAVGTTPGATDVVDFTNAGMATSATASGLNLTSGQTYYVTVQATNNVGLGSAATSDGVTVDTSAPTVDGWVSDGAGTDIKYQASATTLSANWSGVFNDDQSGITGYEWAIGTSAGASNVQGFTSIGAATSALRTGLSLTSAQTYFVTVRASNGADLTSTATSNGVTVDTSAPTATGVPKDGTGADIKYQASTTTLSANWAGVFSDAQSGIGTYEWKVGTTVGGSQLFDFTIAGISGTTASRTDLKLTAGQTYYVTVRASNGAGLTKTGSANGVKVDNTAATVSGAPRDGTGADLKTQASATSVSANWSGVFSDAQSGIITYEWAIGTSAGDTDILGFTSVGTATAKTKTGLALTLGQTYFVTVRATNGAGLTSTATSNGVMVVLAADGYEANNAFATARSLGTFDSFTKTGLTIHNATDVDYYRFIPKTSGTFQVSIQFAQSIGNLDLAIYDSNQTLLGSSTTSADNELVTLTLSAGQTYFVKIFSPVGAMNTYGLRIIKV